MIVAMPGDRNWVWAACVPRFIHPVKVAVIEAFLWVDRPLSSRELDLMFEEEYGVSLVAYHVRGLTTADILQVVRQEPARGAIQTWYRLRKPPLRAG